MRPEMNEHIVFADIKGRCVFWRPFLFKRGMEVLKQGNLTVQ